MHIIIYNKEAVLKKGSSFEYISENRFFTGADAYTLSITFPLKGCQQNLDIFGHINRKDSNLDKLLLPCEIVDRNFHVTGSVNIVEISEMEVKTQFLAGKSVTNYGYDLDERYINYISIGQPTDTATRESRYYLGTPNSSYYTGRVSLPWVNNTSGNMQNKMEWRSNSWYYEGSNTTLSCQYYLLFVLKKVLDFCDYSYDLSALENSSYRYLVIFNTFPDAWEMRDWGQALPHWTVTEFLEQIERFTNGSFSIDRKSKRVTFQFNTDFFAQQKTVVLENIVDQHQVEISKDDNKENTYLEQIGRRYAEGGHQMDDFYDCQWAVNSIGSFSFSTYSSLKSIADPYLTHTGEYTNNIMYRQILHAEDIDMYFILKCYNMELVAFPPKFRHDLRLLPINLFGSNDDSGTEMSIVPVCIDHCDMSIGDCVFLECGTYGEVTEENAHQTFITNRLSNGEQQKEEEYFSKLYVGFWDGTYIQNRSSQDHYYPIPMVDNYYIDMFSNLYTSPSDAMHDFSMRLQRGGMNRKHQVKNKIDQSVKFTFQFITHDGNIPDVQSIFYIHGKKYLAEKITATFTENGISQLLKMVAYRMV